MMPFAILMTTIAPLVAPIVSGWVLVWLNWYYVFWILVMVAILVSTMIFFLVRETSPPERHRPLRIRIIIGNFATSFRHKRVLSYMLASGFSFVGMSSFLSAGLSVCIGINHVASGNFGHYFALNILFLFAITIFNDCFIRRIDALNMFCSGLWIRFIMVARMVISALLGLGSWLLAVSIAALVGCISMVSSNAMVVIFDEFPHMVETTSSLVGTFCLGIGAIVGALLPSMTFSSVWPMIWSTAFCAISSTLFCLYASRPEKR